VTAVSSFSTATNSAPQSSAMLPTAFHVLTPGHMPGGAAHLGSLLTPRRDQVVVHALVEREHGGRRADLRAHVADGSHACPSTETPSRQPLGPLGQHCHIPDQPLASRTRPNRRQTPCFSKAAAHRRVSAPASYAPLPPQCFPPRLPAKAWRRGRGARGAVRACAGHVVNAGAEVLHDRARAALDRQDAGHLADDVLGRAPLAQLARQLHADDLPQDPSRPYSPSAQAEPARLWFASGLARTARRFCLYKNARTQEHVGASLHSMPACRDCQGSYTT
jgi:hypothetical protein